MSKSVEGNTDSRWHHLPKARSWVGSRAYIRGETSRDKANNKCVLNMIQTKFANVEILIVVRTVLAYDILCRLPEVMSKVK